MLRNKNICIVIKAPYTSFSSFLIYSLSIFVVILLFFLYQPLMSTIMTAHLLFLKVHGGFNGLNNRRIFIGALNALPWTGFQLLSFSNQSEQIIKWVRTEPDIILFGQIRTRVTRCYIGLPDNFSPLHNPYLNLLKPSLSTILSLLHNGKTTNRRKLHCFFTAKPFPWTWKPSLPKPHLRIPYLLGLGFVRYYVSNWY